MPGRRSSRFASDSKTVNQLRGIVVLGACLVNNCTYLEVSPSMGVQMTYTRLISVLQHGPDQRLLERHLSHARTMVPRSIRVVCMYLEGMMAIPGLMTYMDWIYRLSYGVHWSRRVKSHQRDLVLLREYMIPKWQYSVDSMVIHSLMTAICIILRMLNGLSQSCRVIYQLHALAPPSPATRTTSTYLVDLMGLID